MGEDKAWVMLTPRPEHMPQFPIFLIKHSYEKSTNMYKYRKTCSTYY